MSKLHKVYVSFALFSFLFASCGNEKPKENTTTPAEGEKQKPVEVIATPKFEKDSAYTFLKKQVDFGPRIPGTKAHAECAVWLAAKMKEYFPNVVTEGGVATTFDNRKYTIKNIIASYNPDSKQRILLCSHWDTRPFADRDTGANKNKVFDSADDGASGVGVLIEAARLISIAKPTLGVDIIFFDIEDYGQPDDSNYPKMEDSWCLGTQYWAANPHVPGYFARFGILLDMVGGKGATFPKEGTSVFYAPDVVDKVWNTAAAMGYGNIFINAHTGQTTDDHLYVNKIANIPCIDIVDYRVDDQDYSPIHHKVSDNLSNIDPDVLGIVGQVIMQVVVQENAKQ